MMSREEHWHREEAGLKGKGGAKTFRRKRAILFLEHLMTKEKVLKKQLETKELQMANPMIAGELKATQSIIAEFIQMFELYEFEPGERQIQQDIGEEKKHVDDEAIDKNNHD